MRPQHDMEMFSRLNVYIMKNSPESKRMILPPGHSVERKLKGRLFIIMWCVLNYTCTDRWIFKVP